MESPENTTPTVYELEMENELRIVTGEENTVSIELLSGFAEMFGSELAQNTSYIFPPYSNISIYSWQGCSIKLFGKTVQSCVTANSFIMISVNIHACLEQQRITSESNFARGPVSLVAGSMNFGRRTFSHFLLNYAARMGRSPLHIDLDVMQNRSLIPGTVSMCKVDQPFHVTEGFSKLPSCVYLYGYNHPRKNTLLYYSLIKKMGEIFQTEFCKENACMYSSGAIIDVSNWIEHKDRANIIDFAVKIFKIDVLFVTYSKKLFKKLRRLISCRVKMVFIPKQNGVIQTSKKQQERVQENLIRQYFYGSIQNPLTPYKFDVKFSDIEIYSASLSGNVNNIDEVNTSIVNVSIQEKLVNCILGLSSADNVNVNIFTTSVKGFICVTGIDIVNEIITVLSPQPAPLTSRILIYSCIKMQ